MAPVFTLAVLGLLLDCAAASPVEDELSLLQSHLGLKPAAAQASAGAEAAAEDLAEESRVPAAAAPAAGRRDLAFVHVPYNFGHTVEHAAMFGSGLLSTGSMLAYLFSIGGFGGLTRTASWSEVYAMTREGGEIWGHLHPDLQQLSNVTGCPLYHTPQKYWPAPVADKYFGNRTVFGMLRDPYERAIAVARGMAANYGSDEQVVRHMGACDVNAAVKQMMKDYLANGAFTKGCTLMPQAEYFDGPYGIALPVNNREFPASMNKVFVEHDYPHMQVEQADVVHHRVACPQFWAGDLDAEARSLVKQAYKRDFDLLCKHFGYCDREESACSYQVPLVCPPWLVRQGYRGRPLPNATRGGAQLVEEEGDSTCTEAGDVLRMAARGRLAEDVLMKLATNRTLLETIAQSISEP